MTTSTAGALTQTTAGTLAPSAVPPPPMIHKEGYFTAAYVLVFGALLLYVVFVVRRFPVRAGGAKTPRS